MSEADAAIDGLQTSIAGVELEHPLINAAGTAKSLDDVKRLARSAVAAVTVGSITFLERSGNAGEVFADRRRYAVNALGMPNRGLDFYRDALPEMVEVVHAQNKPLILSVAGFDADEFASLARMGADAGVDLIELNLGCPNVWHDGRQERIASFDPERVSGAISSTRVGSCPVGVKLSPISDPVLLAEVASAIAEAEAAFVVSCNTFPNGIVLRSDGTSAIDVGMGGVSGETLKPVALGQVGQLRQALPKNIDVVGAGGVSTGTDIADFLQVGASAVGSATAFWRAGEDPQVFGRLLAEWLQ